MWRSEAEMLAVVRARVRALRRRRRVRGALAGAAVAVAVIVAVALNAGTTHSTRVDVGVGPPAPTLTRPQPSSPATTPGGQSVQQLTPVGAEVAWASTAQAGASSTPFFQGIDRSTDGGRSWQVVTPPGLAVATGTSFISASDFLDASHAWVVYGGVASGSPLLLTATADGGRSWSPLGRLPDPDCSLQFATASDGWCVDVAGAAGEDAVTIYRTTDGGRGWSLVSRSARPSSPGRPGTPGSLPVGCDKTLVFLSATEGWAGFNCPVGVSPLYETTDGGRTWVERAVQAPPVSYGSPRLYADPWATVPKVTGSIGAAAMTVGTGGGNITLVYRSANWGASWYPVIPPGSPRNWTVDLIDASDWKLIRGRTILTTDNAGRTWATTTSTLALTNPPDFTTPEIGWEIMGRVLRTTDGGLTWTSVAVPGVGP